MLIDLCETKNQKQNKKSLSHECLSTLPLSVYPAAVKKTLNFRGNGHGPDHTLQDARAPSRQRRVVSSSWAARVSCLLSNKGKSRPKLS